jgi:hypothetical protein
MCLTNYSPLTVHISWGQKVIKVRKYIENLFQIYIENISIHLDRNKPSGSCRVTWLQTWLSEGTIPGSPFQDSPGKSEAAPISETSHMWWYTAVFPDVGGGNRKIVVQSMTRQECQTEPENKINLKRKALGCDLSGGVLA